MDYVKIRKLLNEKTSINSETGCWEFLGNIDNGYGRITIDYIPWQVHRLSATMFLDYNPFLASLDMHVLHRCNNRRCWNPEHLYIGSNDQNIQDKVDAGNSRNQNSGVTHCKMGHEFTPENTYHRQKGDKYERHCKECQRARSREYQRKRYSLIKFKNEAG